MLSRVCGVAEAITDVDHNYVYPGGMLVCINLRLIYM